MSEPTLAEMIAKWRKRHDDDDDKQSLACCALTCADELAAFHARAIAVVHGWRHDECDSFMLESLHLPQTETHVPRQCRACMMLALLGDLQP